AEIEAEREVGVGGARLVQEQRPFQRAEPQTERIRVADARPEPYAGAAQAVQADFGRTPGDLFEARRLDEPAELIERAALQRKPDGGEDRDSNRQSHERMRVQNVGR